MLNVKHIIKIYVFIHIPDNNTGGGMVSVLDLLHFMRMHRA
jgi:hypothetical protein